MARRNGDVVEKAKPHARGPFGVVPRGADGAEGVFGLARQNCLYRVTGRSGGAEGGGIAFRADGGVNVQRIGPARAGAFHAFYIIAVVNDGYLVYGGIRRLYPLFARNQLFDLAVDDAQTVRVLRVVPRIVFEE